MNCFSSFQCISEDLQDTKVVFMCRLFVGNLVNGWKEENLTILFVRHGIVPKAVKLIKNKNRRGQIHSIGYAFANVKDIYDRNRAMERLNGYPVKCIPTVVKIANEQPDRLAYKKLCSSCRQCHGLKRFGGDK